MLVAVLVSEFLDVCLYAFNLLRLLKQLFLLGLEHRDHVKADLDLIFLGQTISIYLRRLLPQRGKSW